jgi:hypothetical protein
MCMMAPGKRHAAARVTWAGRRLAHPEDQWPIDALMTVRQPEGRGGRGGCGRGGASER